MTKDKSPDIKEQAKQDYMSGMKYNDLSEKYNVTINTIKSWKQRYKWNRKSVHTKSEKGAHKKEKKNADYIIEGINTTDLNDKQKLFCIYYTKYFNATKAYQKAYGCDYNTAMVNGCNLLRNTKIKNEITVLKADKLKGAMLEPVDIIQKYIDIAFSDITDFVEFGQREEQVLAMYGPVYVGKGPDKKPVMHTVNYVDLKGCNGIDSSVISEVSQGRDGIKIKLPDKMKALDWLANHMDLLDTATKEKLKIEKDKLDLEKAKANMGIDDDDETGVVLLPDIDYSLEGGEQDADSSKEKDS